MYINNRATSANIVDKNTKILKVNEKRKPKMLHNRKNSNINLYKFKQQSWLEFNYI